MKTNKGLVEYAKAQLGRPYWYGTYGKISSPGLYAQKKKQYPKYYTANDFSKQYGQRVHDCVGLIKGYCWSETPTSNPVYRSNGCPDTSANGMYNYCKKKGTNMKTMPDVPGTLVFMSGHVGVYIGGGYVIEARGHKYGVVKTALNSRPWVKWGQPSFITYIDDAPTGTKKTVIVTGGSVNVRTGAGTLHKIVFVAHKGDKFEYVETASNGWFKIKRNGIEYYISNKYSKIE